jgi:hypothetical protein
MELDVVEVAVRSVVPTLLLLLLSPATEAAVVVDGLSEEEPADAEVLTEE